MVRSLLASVTLAAALSVPAASFARDLHYAPLPRALAGWTGTTTGAAGAT